MGYGPTYNGGGKGDCRDKIVRVHGVQFASEIGAGKPTPGFIGPTNYLSFAVNDEAWFHFTLPADIDPTADIVVFVDWTPELSEATRTASFEFDYLVMGQNGDLVSVEDDTLTVTDEAVPVTAWNDIESQFTIPAADILATDHEIHTKLKRIASSNDPTDIAVHHVWAEVVTA